MSEDASFELDVFLPGELVDLCIPTSDFALKSNWYNWFNDRNLVKYLEQGVFPNTRKKQLEYFESIPGSRLVLIIVDKKAAPIGVISLSSINHQKKNCDVALVVSDDGDKRLKSFVGLESMALITAHAFELLGMQRVNAGQHIKLAGWQNRLELIGYQLEGLHINGFVEGNKSDDGVSIAASRDSYEYLASRREGSLWDNYENMRRRVKSLPNKTYLDILINIYENDRKEYYKNIYSL